MVRDIVTKKETESNLPQGRAFRNDEYVNSVEVQNHKSLVQFNGKLIFSAALWYLRSGNWKEVHHTKQTCRERTIWFQTFSLVTWIGFPTLWPLPVHILKGKIRNHSKIERSEFSKWTLKRTFQAMRSILIIFTNNTLKPNKMKWNTEKEKKISK